MPVDCNSNKRIAIVIPPSNIREQYGSLASAAPELPPLGIGFIAKYLKLKKIDIDIYDFSVNRKNLPDFFDNINSYSVIGIPVFITTLPDAIKFIKIIKSKNNRCLTVVGGPHVTLFPEEFFINDVDVVVKGEGEIPFYEIIAEVFSGAYDFSQIRGIYFKNNGNFIYTGDSRYLSDLDVVDSPLINKFKLSFYYPPIHVLGRKVVHTLTSRGCPYSCAFCAASKIFKSQVRHRSVDLVLRELREYIAAGYDSIIFYDDIFTVNRKRVIELCKKIIFSKTKIKWMCFTRTDLVDKELLAYMKDAGCYLITFGCESGNDKTLTLLKKHLTVEKNYEGIALTDSIGILAASSFMIGLPGEDRFDIERTISFAKNSKLTFAYFPIFEPYKGTEIFELSNKRGVWITGSKFKNRILNYQEKVWVPEGFTRDEIEGYARRAFKEFYLRYQTIGKIGNRIISKMPFSRKIKFILSGFDYFFLEKFKNKQRRFGSRY